MAPAPVPVRPPALLLALEDNSGAQGDGDAGNYRVGRVQCHPACGMAAAASRIKGSQMCSNCTLGLLTRDTKLLRTQLLVIVKKRDTWCARLTACLPVCR